MNTQAANGEIGAAPYGAGIRRSGCRTTNVWEYDFEGNVGVVETHISHLRKKLGPQAARQIKTVRGAGYLLHQPET